MRKNQGFTLVEILIVVVILGILAAIVIPQFSDASTQSKVSSVQSSLQSMRSQLSLYKIQHNDVPPAATTFADQMTGYTNISGTVSSDGTKTAEYCYGPYLKSVPRNPLSDGSDIGTSTTADWVYTVDTTTNEADISAGYGGETVINVVVNGETVTLNSL